MPDKAILNRFLYHIVDFREWPQQRVGHFSSQFVVESMLERSEVCEAIF